MAIFGIIGSALAFKHPKASGVILIIAAFVLINIGVSTPYIGMAIFGAIIALAGIFAFAGSKKKSTTKEIDRDVMG